MEADLDAHGLILEVLRDGNPSRIARALRTMPEHTAQLDTCQYEDD